MKSILTRATLLCVLFSVLVIYFDAGAVEPDSQDPNPCVTPLVGNAESAQALLDILRVRIMPAGSVEASAQDFAPVLLAQPVPPIEGAVQGHAQALLNLLDIGEFALFVGQEASGAEVLYICRPLQRESCLAITRLERGERVEDFTMISQDPANTLVELRTSRQRYVLSLMPAATAKP